MKKSELEEYELKTQIEKRHLEHLKPHEFGCEEILEAPVEKRKKPAFLSSLSGKDRKKAIVIFSEILKRHFEPDGYW